MSDTIDIAGSLRGLEQRHFPDIALVGLSTTLATNAIVEGARSRVLGILSHPQNILQCLSEKGQSMCCKSGRFPSYGQDGPGSLDNDAENRYRYKSALFGPTSPQS